jgi:hypothetical protein
MMKFHVVLLTDQLLSEQEITSSLQLNQGDDDNLACMKKRRELEEDAVLREERS